MTRSKLLYGFGKENRLKPTVTFLIYAGSEPWDASRDIHGMLDFTDIPETLKNKVANYHINLIEIRKLSEEQLALLQTDLRNVFQFIRYAEDKKALLELVESDDYYKNMDEEAYMVVANYTHSKELIQEEKYLTEEGKMDMCKAIIDLIADGRTEGRIEGRMEGRMEGKTDGEVHSIIVLLQRVGTVSSEMQEELAEIRDEEILQKLLIEAASAKSVEGFRKVLDEMKCAE